MAGLDIIDLKILKRLQEEGRITNLQLSSDVGLSPAPTLERVKKLEQSEIITSYHAKLDHNKLGLGIQALVMINLIRQIDNAISNFKNAINEIPEVVECLQITGNADYILRIMVTDIKAFERLIGEKLSKIEEIGQMQTMVILNEVKKTNVLPLNYKNEH